MRKKIEVTSSGAQGEAEVSCEVMGSSQDENTHKVEQVELIFSGRLIAPKLSRRSSVLAEPSTQLSGEHIILIMDVSSSMNGGQRLETLRQLALQLYHSKPLGTVFTLIAFNDEVKPYDAITKLKGDEKKFVDQLNALQTSGTTNIHKGWLAGLDKLSRTADQTSIFLMTDGGQNCDYPSTLPHQLQGDSAVEKSAPTDGIARTAQVTRQVIERLKGAGTVNIGVMLGGIDAADKGFLTKLTAALSRSTCSHCWWLNSEKLSDDGTISGRRVEDIVQRLFYKNCWVSVYAEEYSSGSRSTYKRIITQEVPLDQLNEVSDLHVTLPISSDSERVIQYTAIVNSPYGQRRFIFSNATELGKAILEGKEETETTYEGSGELVDVTEEVVPPPHAKLAPRATTEDSQVVDMAEVLRLLQSLQKDVALIKENVDGLKRAVGCVQKDGSGEIATRSVEQRLEGLEQALGNVNATLKEKGAQPDDGSEKSVSDGAAFFSPR